MLDVCNCLFGRVPDMLIGIVVWCIGWHGDEVDAFKQAACFQLSSNLQAFVKRGIVTDNADLFVWVFTQELFSRFQYFITVLPGHLVEMAAKSLLVQEADVTL